MNPSITKLFRKDDGLNKAAEHARRKAIKEEPNLSYDDLETEEYQAFLSFQATKVVFWSCVAAIVVVTVIYFTLIPHK